MNAPPTKRLMRNLLDSARRDGPSAAEKARIWEKVALAPHLSLVGSAVTASTPPRAIAAGGASAKAIGGLTVVGLSAGKLLLAGALAGGVLAGSVSLVVARGLPSGHASVGSRGGDVQATVIHANAMDHSPSGHAAGPPSRGVASRADDEPTPWTAYQAPPPVAQTISAAPAGEVEPSAPQRPARVAPSRGPSASREPGGPSPLMREAALVSEVRTDVVQGKAASALELLDAIGRDGTHSLEPEELSLRVRALRMLGRKTAAEQVERSLRDRYPDSFPAR